MIDTTALHWLSLEELEGRGMIRKNLKKWGICNLRTGDQILTKFDI